MRSSLALGFALALFQPQAHSQVQLQTRPQLQLQARPPVKPPIPRRAPMPKTVAVQTPPPAPPVQAPPLPPPGGLIAAVTLADIGFNNGLRLANLGGQRELFVPLPEGSDVAASNLVLVLDDFSAHDARRNLEVQVNDRTVAAIVLDGHSRERVIRVPLGRIKPKDGYLKLSFLYSGAATLDRCIDVRYVGDSLTVRPETAVELDVGSSNNLDVATTAALMPRDVAVVLPGRRVAATEMATAVMVARELVFSGRRVTYYHGFDELTRLAKHDDGRWTRGIVLVGPLADAVGVIDSPITRVAGELRHFGMLDAVRVGGLPALVVSDAESVHAGQLFASPMRAATRGVASASVGETSPVELPTDRVTFDQLAIPPEEVEVFGRAELTAVIDARRLPVATRPTRLLLDVMVAPDGDGARAVVSTFVNERLIGSTVAATSDTTHLDLPLPDGLVGTVANVRIVVQRDSAQGNCRFEPQGYPAQILGSSSIVLASANGALHDFSDLISHFVHGIDILVPASAADQPAHVLGMLVEAANQLSPVTAPLQVSYVPAGSAPVPAAPFIAVSDTPPSGMSPRVRFDRGRVAVVDRSGRTLLDLGGFVGGAVAQVVGQGDSSGLWIRPLSPDGTAPAPAELHLDHGDVAFIDDNGVALAMSTQRDTLVSITYPDQVSWLTVAERFRSWIIAGLWLFATAALLLMLQRIFRRRPRSASE